MKQTVLLLFTCALMLFLLVSCAPKQDSASAADVYIELANAHIANGEYDAAIEMLQKGYENTGDAQLYALLKETIAKQSSDSENSSPAETTAQALDLVDTQKMIADLVEREANSFCFDAGFDVIGFSSVEILRRNSEGETDDVYIKALLESEDYTAEAEYALHYLKYDIGGWYLETYEVTLKSCMPKRPQMTDEEFVSMMLKEFGSCTIKNREQKVEDDVYYDVIDFVVTYDCGYLSVIFEGKYNSEFNELCWYSYRDLAFAGYDWSEFLGTWQYTRGKSIDLQVEILGIEQISEKEVEILYNCSSYVYDTVFFEVRNDDKRENLTATLTFQYEEKTINGMQVKIPYEGKDFGIPWYNGNAYLNFHYTDGIRNFKEISTGGTVTFEKIS